MLPNVNEQEVRRVTEMDKTDISSANHITMGAEFATWRPSCGKGIS